MATSIFFYRKKARIFYPSFGEILQCLDKFGKKGYNNKKVNRKGENYV